jgi:carboxypeptidase family protein
MRVRRIACFVCLAVTVGSRAGAQISTGEIFGRVTDGTGAMLPGVTVTLTSPALIQAQSTVSAAGGGYRFPNLPVGAYSVTFELAGFKKTVRTDVVIETGFNAEINAKLEISSVEETVTVSGVSPVVDTKSATLGTNFNKALLDAIPSARDPWVILEQTPGMVMDRENVGGNQSGQQSSFSARGTSANQQWNLDGGTVTDMASSSAPAYYDFDAFQEIQIMTAGGDASQEAGGVAINLVTKSGSNQFKGTARYYDANQKFESENAPAEVIKQGGGAGNPIKDVAEYGFEAGGPIKKNKVWFWGAANRNTIRIGVLGVLKPGAPAGSDSVDDLETDLSDLNNENLKVNFQAAAGHRSTFLYSRNNKIRNMRGASLTVRLPATTRQTAPVDYFKGQHQWTVNNRFLLDGQYSYYDAGFVLDYHADELATVQRLRYVDQNNLDDRSGTYSGNIRPQYEAKIEGNYFAAQRLGGDHALKFGLRWRSTPFETISKSAGGALVRIRASGQNEVDIIRDGDTSRDMWEYSTYFNDAYKRGRATINWGIRFDHQRDRALPTHIPANPILPDLLPAVTFGGAPSAVAYNNVAPRLSVTYDLSGTGKTVLKAGVNRYYGLGITTAGVLSPTGSTTLSYFWTDLNGDLFAQRNEILFSRGFRATPSSNYDPSNPLAVVTPTTVDPDLKNDTTDEVLVSLDRELMPEFGVGVSYIYRRYDDMQDTYRNGVAASSYSPVSFTRACGNTLCDQPSYSGVYYQRQTALPTASTFRNYVYYRTYNGFEATARKRFSKRWLMNSSFTFNRTRFYYPVVDDFAPGSTTGDPTNYDMQNGRDSSGTSGINGPRWILKLSGMYALPWGMSAAAFFNTREGIQFNRTIQSPNRTGSLGTINVNIEPQGTRHLEPFRQLDLHWDKTLRFDRRHTSFNVDVFNALNAATVLGRISRQDASNANYVQTILAPRIARFGWKVSF